MAKSTINLQSVFDEIAGKAIPDPRSQDSGYGDVLALGMGTDVMADLVTERFNWKWNRAAAAPFYTNAWQQDYPQLAQPDGPIGWGQDCDICDINSTSLPKPYNWNGSIKWARELTRTNLPNARPWRIAWMYNRELTWGTWPGAAKVYSPLIASGPVGSNPIMNFIDVNGNLLILTGFGTTGGAAPAAAANAAEGTTVGDGSCTWTVVSPDSQGFRLDCAASAGVTFQILPSYQLDALIFTDYAQLLTPIPDSFARHFKRGVEALCLKASPNPGDQPRGDRAYSVWLQSLETIKKQGDKEPNVYGLAPATSPVETRWGCQGQHTADQPWG